MRKTEFLYVDGVVVPRLDNIEWFVGPCCKPSPGVTAAQTRGSTNGLCGQDVASQHAICLSCHSDPVWNDVWDVRALLCGALLLVQNPGAAHRVHAVLFRLCGT